MKEYTVETTFTFSGTFKVKAETKQEARELVTTSCGLVMGGGIHSTLSDDEIDWDFETHPTKKIKSVK